MKRPATTALIDFDFTTPDGPELSKTKFCVYNSGIVKAPAYRRDQRTLRHAHPESLRIDVAWGPDWSHYRHPIVRREPDGTMSYDFDELNAIARVLHANGVKPYWSYCYTPSALQPAGGDWRHQPEDVTAWADLVVASARQAQDLGIPTGYHEIYNEPDLRDEHTAEGTFYAGTLDDYLESYAATATALRTALPHARIGGPALASILANKHWMDAFLDRVVRDSLPLDFISFHHYGTQTLSLAIDLITATVAARPELSETEIHLNEYNSFPIDYPRGGFQDGHHLAAALLADFHALLSHPRITKVNWAQFMDSGQGNYSGLIDIDGRPKPAYQAYAWYQNLPQHRGTATVAGPAGVGAFAAHDGGTNRQALVWNRTGNDLDLELVLPAGPTWTTSTLQADGRTEATRRGRQTIRLANGAVARVSETFQDEGMSSPSVPQA